MPVAMGGLGLTSAVDHSAGAYTASVLSSEILKQGLLPNGNISTDLSNVVALLNTKVQEELSEEELFGMSQKAVSLSINLKLQQSLTNSLSELRDKARMASLSLPHAGDWLNVIPSPVLGLHVRPQEFR